MNKSELLKQFGALKRMLENFDNPENRDKLFYYDHCWGCFDGGRMDEFDCNECNKCNQCENCTDSYDCDDCYYCHDCSDCYTCLLCVGISGKSDGYWLLNKQVEKEVYYNALKEIMGDSYCRHKRKPTKVAHC